MNYGSELRSLLFDKLSFLLEDRWRVFISPDGDISKLPFEVLPLQNEEGYFIDRYTISYLSTARDILRFGIKNKRRPSKRLIAADPDYDLGMQSLDNENKLFRRLSGQKKKVRRSRHC